MTTKLLSLYLLLTSIAVNAQVNAGPRITALGGSGVALQDTWSLQSNQAGIGALKKPVVSVAYEREFFNPELSRQSALLVLPYRNNSFGLSFQNYGFSVYNEQRAGFSYCRNFGDVLFAALSFNFHQLKIQQYGSARTYSVEFGLQYSINDKLLFGTHISNPSRSSYSEQAGAVPVSMEFGASYKFSDNVLFNSGLVKILNSNLDLRTGLEYWMAGWLAVRGGISVNPFRQYAGFGFIHSGLRVDGAVSSHSVLGFSPQIALSYEF